MPVSLSVKNVPDELADRLRARAKENHRSLQGELLAILEASLPPQQLTVDEVYQRMRERGIKTPDDSVQIIRELRGSPEPRLSVHEVHEYAKSLGFQTPGDSVQIIREMRDTRHGG